MRILSIKYHLSADHSSSTYQFLSVEKLTAEQRDFVTKLTGKTPKGRGLHIHYQGEHEIPWEWHKKLLTGPYDVLVSESYDHWQAEFTAPYDKALYEQLQKYECPGDLEGFEVEHVEHLIYCTLNFHVEYGSDFFDYDADAVQQIADLFEDIRSDILDGDFSALRAIYEIYGQSVENEEQNMTDDEVVFSENARLLQSFLTSV